MSSPGTVTLAFAESAEKTTCLDVPEISKSFSERLTINNTTGDSITSDLVLTFAGDDDISNFEFELGGTEGSVDNNTVTFEDVLANTGLNIYDLNIEYIGDTPQGFALNFNLVFNEESLEEQSLNYNFINCQSKVQVLAVSESKDVCSFVGGYNLDTEIVVYNPTLQPLSFNKIELNYSEGEVGNVTFNLNEVDASTNNLATTS